MRGLLFVVVASAAALTPTTRRGWAQSLAAGSASLATASTAAGPPGGFKDKPIEQPTSKVNINTSQAPAYMDCPGMYGARRGTFDATPTRHLRHDTGTRRSPRGS